MKSFSLPAGEKIVVRSPNWLGDAIMSIPALIRLKERWPENPISILASPKLLPLWQMQPAVSEVVPLENSLLKTVRLLRGNNFASAVVFPNSFRTGLEMFLAGIPLRVGFAVNGRSLLLTHSKTPPHPVKTTKKKTLEEIKRSAGLTQARGNPDYKYHHLFYYLNLVQLAGASNVLCAPTLVPPQQLSANEITVGMNPGAEYGPAKRWPVENFVAAGKLIMANTPARIVIFGGPGDVDLCEQLEAGINSPRVSSLAGKTTLQQLASHLKACKVLVTNDTGPMHLAAAVGTPVVGLFGSTLSDLTSPGIPGDPAHSILQSTVGCSPCFWRECPIDFRCMKQFTPEDVAEIVRGKLG